MSYTVLHHIGGKAFADCQEGTSLIHNPALGKVIGEVHFAGRKTCDFAIESAKTAFESWSNTPPIKRARILFNFRTLLEKYQTDLAALITREHGKTLPDAMGEVARAIEVVELHCGILSELKGTFTADVASEIDCHTLRQSLGVCVGVSPFNFPVMVPVWMMIPAIACGNSFILKPSEQDPSSAVRLLELLSEAGLPAGVANCLHGNKETVEYLITHEDIAACTAVASTPVAESIYTMATASGKRAHTFGSAKNHCVVMPDAHLEQAAEAIVGAAFGSAGERCMAISVAVIVGHETHAQLLPHLLPKIKAIRIGEGMEPSNDMGPLISCQHRERVLTACDAGIEEGAALLIDGRAYQHPEFSEGYFVGPCLFDNVDESMSIYQNEIFGPVLCLMQVDSFEAAIALVNRNQYGNGTAIFTRDGFSAREYSHRVSVGMVGINIPIPVPIASHPFGGWKRSSFGDTNMHGLESIHFYTRLKTITSKWPVTKLSGGAFNMPSHE